MVNFGEEPPRVGLAAVAEPVGGSEPEPVWAPELDELARREALARRMGGEERVARARAAGRLTVRERIDLLLDPGSFEEYGALAGFATYEGDRMKDFLPANCVM